MTNSQIIYEDNHLLVVVKPPNMPTQADASGDLDIQTAMKQYIADTYNKPGNVYLGLVHRMDRPVGGLLVLAKTSKAAQRLSDQVQHKAMQREYLAVVHGKAHDLLNLTDWLHKDERTNTVHVVPPNTPGAKEAKLDARLMGIIGEETDSPLSLYRVRLYTGRSHQIRVQLSHAGFPIWGDARYGIDPAGCQIALWGARLTLMHPTKKEPMTFVNLPDGRPWDRFPHLEKAVESHWEKLG